MERWATGRGRGDRQARQCSAVPFAVSGKQISWAMAGMTQMETKKTFHIWTKSPERPRPAASPNLPHPQPPALSPSGPLALSPVP